MKGQEAVCRGGRPVSMVAGQTSRRQVLKRLPQPAASRKQATLARTHPHCPAARSIQTATGAGSGRTSGASGADLTGRTDRQKEGRFVQRSNECKMISITLMIRKVLENKIHLLVLLISDKSKK